MSYALLVKGVLGAVALVMLLGLWEATPWIGPRARIAHVQADLDKATKRAKWNYDQAVAWKASFDQSERNREVEKGVAQTAVNDNAKACDKRVAEARRSSQAIERIVRVPAKTDAAGCPVRELLDAGELRDAIGGPGR